VDGLSSSLSLPISWLILAAVLHSCHVYVVSCMYVSIKRSNN
jgi:hypothetical protein